MCQGAFFIYPGNEPKSVLARDLGDCRDNLGLLQNEFFIQNIRFCLKTVYYISMNSSILQQPLKFNPET